MRIPIISGIVGAALAVGVSPASAQVDDSAAATDSAAPAAVTEPDLPTPAGYLFGPHDVIKIGVVGRDDFNQQVLVQDDGTISLALIGSLTVAKLTPLQLKGLIEQRLRSGGYFINPEVSVVLSGATSQYAVVLGEIGHPGLATLDRPYRLSELIARSGGVRPGSDLVTMTEAGGTSRVFSLKSMATNGSPDPIVPPGAKVFVQPAQVYYMYGQVGQPGTFNLDREMTVRNALARAGGLSALGSPKKVTIYRGDQEMKHVDLNAKIMAGDTINVGERFF